MARCRRPSSSERRDPFPSECPLSGAEGEKAVRGGRQLIGRVSFVRPHEPGEPTVGPSRSGDPGVDGCDLDRSPGPAGGWLRRCAAAESSGPPSPFMTGPMGVASFTDTGMPRSRSVPASSTSREPRIPGASSRMSRLSRHSTGCGSRP